jgi:hypothetical protein
MPTITISDETYHLLEQQAKITQRTPEDVLNDVLRRELSPYPDAISTSVPEVPASHHAAELALARHNYAIFKQRLPELLKEHAGEFVALRHGQIVGFGKDKKALWYQIRNQYGSSGILVMEVTETPRVMHVSFQSIRKVQ